jgi:uncharacterized glyoxalase superfamily protein PhnB
MPQPIPYVAFDGNCADAMRFYAQAAAGEMIDMSKQHA